jgi:hypothetical protein
MRGQNGDKISLHGKTKVAICDAMNILEKLKRKKLLDEKIARKNLSLYSERIFH